MRRALPVLRTLHQASAGAADASAAAAVGGQRAASTFTFASVADAPPPPTGSAISVSLKQAGGKVEVAVNAGGASAKASYAAGEARGAGSLTLYDTPRVSVLHASLMNYLLRLTYERYQILAEWPDFTQMYGKDFYYRSHADELRNFYSLVDDFHRMWDTVTEFDSLSLLASEMVPAYRRKRLSTVHPAAGPAVANGVVTQFLLAGAK